MPSQSQPTPLGTPTPTSAPVQPPSVRRPPPANNPPGFRPTNSTGRMSAVLLVASIKRHFPYLWPDEAQTFAASVAERRSINASHEIARRMGARMPGAAA